jgi:hypothetical protein
MAQEITEFFGVSFCATTPCRLTFLYGVLIITLGRAVQEIRSEPIAGYGES